MLRHDPVHGLKNLQTGPVFRRSREFGRPLGRARFSTTRKKVYGFSKRHDLLLLSHLVFPEMPVGTGAAGSPKPTWPLPSAVAADGSADNPRDMILHYVK